MTSTAEENPTTSTTDTTADMDVDEPATVVAAEDEMETKPAAAAAAAAAATATAVNDDNNDLPPPRDSLNGCWIMDKSRGEWSMSGYLECMNVNELAIKAHEKGENEFDTYHTIELDDKRVKITKRSRVNADLVVDLPLGEEHVEYIPPGDRPKTSLATSEHDGHLHITSSLHTVNGIASVTDLKQLETNVDGDPRKVVMVQTLTITNAATHKVHTTTRYFIPYEQTPPHLVPT